MDRRSVIGASFAVCAAAATGSANAAGLDGATRNWLRLTADLSGRTTWGVLRGDVWGFLPQADDLTTEAFARRLYGYWSLVARKAITQADGSIRVKLKGWTFYLDAETGAIVTRIANPYTGQTVRCPPLSGPAATLSFGGGTAQPVTLRECRIGANVWLELDRISRFKPSDTTWFKLEADLTSYACKAIDLERLDLSHIPNTWSHNLVAEWQTWMKMHGAPGHILFKGDGAFVDGPADVPVLAAAIEDRFPGTLRDTLAWSAS